MLLCSRAGWFLTLKTVGTNSADPAKTMKVQESTVTQILNGNIKISVDMAQRLEKLPGFGAQLLRDMRSAFTIGQASNFRPNFVALQKTSTPLPMRKALFSQTVSALHKFSHTSGKVPVCNQVLIILNI